MTSSLLLLNQFADLATSMSTKLRLLLSMQLHPWAFRRNTSSSILPDRPLAIPCFVVVLAAHCRLWIVLLHLILDIDRWLERYSKTDLDDSLKDFIRQYTERCGKVKLVMRKQRYYIESIFPDHLQTLLRNPTILKARLDNREGYSFDVVEESIEASSPSAASAPKASSQHLVQSLVAGGGEEGAVNGASANPRRDFHARDLKTGFLIASSIDQVWFLFENIRFILQDGFCSFCLFGRTDKRRHFHIWKQRTSTSREQAANLFH